MTERHTMVMGFPKQHDGTTRNWSWGFPKQHDGTTRRGASGFPKQRDGKREV
ncbi:MAG: hypothetical protein GY801_25540 [bacterium]|nr:hypothetical protein [bacterium]